MTLGDLATVAEHELPIVVVVMNDRAYGAERHWLDVLELPHQRSQLPEHDFAQIADGLGIEAVRVRSMDELDRVGSLIATPRQAPILIDCLIKPEVRAQWFAHR
jgi:thiamine pyrophosphate-dependent acetolactate synthase large subunit-like protein